jgi:hypothetical protein
MLALHLCLLFAFLALPPFADAWLAQKQPP